MAAELTERNGSVQVAARRNLFPIKSGFLDSYDVFPDGKQFLLHRDVTPAIPTPLSLVVNWPAELKK